MFVAQAMAQVMCASVSRPSVFFYAPFDRFGADPCLGLWLERRHNALEVLGVWVERLVDLVRLVNAEQRSTSCPGLVIEADEAPGPPAGEPGGPAAGGGSGNPHPV